MSESEWGTQVAWRVLGALEGGALALAAAAAAAALAARRTQRPAPHPPATALISNTTNPLGSELARQLQSRGCIVSDATSRAVSGATSETASRVDALILVGAEPKSEGLDGLSEMVSEDIFEHLKQLESLSVRVRPGGRLAWAARGRAGGAWLGAAAAHDEMLRAQLHLVARTSQCEAVWVKRGDQIGTTAANVIAALYGHPDGSTQFSIRTLAARLRDYISRWFKAVS